MTYTTYAFYVLLLFLPTIPLFVVRAEDQEQISYQAEHLENTRINNRNCRKLERNVVMTFYPSGMVLTADKAYQYYDDAVEDPIEASGNVKIVDKEGNTITAKQLTYYPDKKSATLRGDVCCKSPKAAFYTPTLSYHIQTKEGIFEEGGKLVQDQMVLTSQKGSYEGVKHKVILSEKVTLVDPDYTLHCTQLCYDTENEIAEFQGHTNVIQADNNLTTEKGGSYAITKKQLIFHYGELINKDMVLTADYMEIMDKKDCQAKGHVIVKSKTDDMTLKGEQAHHSEKEKKTEITGRPLLTKTVNNETMYLRADRFIALEKPQPEGEPIQEVHALENVQLYQESLQGLADSAMYNAKEKTIYIHNQPIIWSGGYQITGEGVSLVIEEEERVKLVINKKLFMVSADPVDNYNQIKGEKMVAYFKEGFVEKMAITGSGESLYFVLEDDNELIGMNHIRCNDMELYMKDNVLERMECRPQPQGIFHPTALLKPDEMKLSDFVWHGDKWPTKEKVLAYPAQVLPQKDSDKDLEESKKTKEKGV